MLFISRKLAKSKWIGYNCFTFSSRFRMNFGVCKGLRMSRLPLQSPTGFHGLFVFFYTFNSRFPLVAGSAVFLWLRFGLFCPASVRNVHAIDCQQKTVQIRKTEVKHGITPYWMWSRPALDCKMNYSIIFDFCRIKKYINTWFYVVFFIELFLLFCAEKKTSPPTCPRRVPWNRSLASSLSQKWQLLRIVCETWLSAQGAPTAKLRKLPGFLTAPMTSD